MDSKYPGILFYCKPITAHITSSETLIDMLGDEGISLHIPENSLCSTEQSTKLSICPCLNGPFLLPESYEPASVPYLIHHTQSRSQRPITVQMHHYASLLNEEDCEHMCFLSASAIPDYEETQRPVYVFKEIQGAKGRFKPGCQIGEISLKHFCFLIAGRRRREQESAHEHTQGKAGSTSFPM